MPILLTTQKTVPIWLDAHADAPAAERPTLYVRALTREEAFAETDEVEAHTAETDPRKKSAILDAMLLRRVRRASGFAVQDADDPSAPVRTLDTPAAVLAVLTLAEAYEVFRKAVAAVMPGVPEKKASPSPHESGREPSAPTA